MQSQWFPESEVAGQRANSQRTYIVLRRIQVIIILFSIWILAIVLPTVRFAPANWTLLKMERIHEYVSPGMELLLEITGICLIVSMAILAGLIVLSIWRARRKKRKDDDFIFYRENPPIHWAVYVVLVVLFSGLGGLIWLSWRHANIFEGLMIPQRSAETSRGQGEPPSAHKPSASETTRPESHTTVSFNRRAPLILALLVLLSLSIRYILKSGPSKEGLEAPEFIQIASSAAKELERGGDPSDIVLRCYRDMCKILGRKVTMSRDLTAREFTKLLFQAGIHEQEVARLSDLFERVRYGRHITDSEEQAEAVGLLKSIEAKYGRSSNET